MGEGKLKVRIRDGVYYRPGTTDLDELKSVRAYDKAGVRSGDMVLDLGGHIGLAGRRFKEQGAGHVVAYEPDPENAAMYRLNVPSASVKTAAVAGKAGRAQFHVASGEARSRTRGSLRAYRGRDQLTVTVEAFEEVLYRVRPDVIKMDIEGAEFDLIGADLTGVRAVTAELHLHQAEWKDKLPDFLRWMYEEGLRPDRDLQKYVDSTAGWPLVAAWTRT